MRLRDPVCGMTIDGEDAAGTVRHGSAVYSFCTEACMSAFRRHPERFVGSLDDSDGRGEIAPNGPRTRDAATVARCPYCGEEAHATAAPPVVGRLSLDECEAIILGEWRRRLGREAGPEHRGGIVRTLLIAALEAEGGESRAPVPDHLPRAAGAGDRAPDAVSGYRESSALSRAIWDVLSTSGLPFDRATSLMGWIDRWLALAV